jgi:MSHA pilin protein MshD
MSARPVRGFTLIELVMFIVIAGIAMAALFSVFNLMVGRSADPQFRKQMLAIAESLMEEVQLMPFTFCDPDDANAATATSTTVGPGGCAATSEDTTIGPEPSESRYSLTTPFDNVSDYHGFAMPFGGMADITSATPIPGLAAYRASITVAPTALTAGGDTVPAAHSLKISVLVEGPAGLSLTLDGYRTRYAPTTLP